MILFLLVAIPAVFGALAFGVRNLRAGLYILVAVSLLHLIGVASLWSGGVGLEFGMFYALDHLGLLFLTIVSLLFFAVSLYSISYLLQGTHDAQSATHRFVPCLLLFLAAMTQVTVTQHLGVMWVAVEATTLSSAPLIYFYRRRGALEAAWKYLLLCSVGIALALLGVFSLGIAATGAADTSASLTLAFLQTAAPTMPKPWLQTAFVLALVGFGTKMGLAPLHNWLPDAHSQAPSPVSAMLSGSLLNCAFLAIIRFYQVCLASGDADFARTLLITLGMLSLAIACVFMVRQGDYKRLFAYSSIENMGILAIGLGIGGGAVYGALLHAVNHSLCKAGLFFTAGNVLREYGTTSAGDVRGVFRRLPVTGFLMMTLFLALGGLPPFGPFISEFMIFRSAIVGPGQFWLGVLFAVMIAIAFLGMAGVVLPMLQGGADGHKTQPAREASLSIGAPLFLACGALVLGVYVPQFLADVLRAAAGLLGG
jgi:hydrogenase-4 component F